MGKDDKPNPKVTQDDKSNSNDDNWVAAPLKTRLIGAAKRVDKSD